MTNRAREDQGQASIPPEGAGSIITSFDTQGNTLAVAVRVGELVLEVVLDRKGALEYLRANSLLYNMM